MADMTEKFESVAAFLSDTDWSANPTLTFDDICSMFSADPLRMDNLMYEHFGMSGDEIIRQYRKNSS